MSFRLRPASRTYTGRYPPSSRALCLCILAACIGGRAIHAQSVQADEGEYTYALVGIPLETALERLLDETHISLVYETDLVRRRTTFCKAERVSLEPLLECVLRGTGVDYIRLSSGTYVIVEASKAPTRIGSLNGDVRDAETGMPLGDASVYLVEEAAGTASNRDGRFAFPALRTGPHRLVVTHVSYRDAVQSVNITTEEPKRVSVALFPRVILSAPVVITGFNSNLPREPLGAEVLTGDELNIGVVGTPDVVREVASVVGVRLGDALADVHVQGGASDEQQFLLDGVPIFMPIPNGGFVGPFSPFAIGRVTVQKAGFGASRGGGLSGVVDVEHGLGSAERSGLTAHLDPLSLNVRWDGRAGAHDRMAATWMVVARGGLWGIYQPKPLDRLFRSWAMPDRFLFDALRPEDGSPDSALTGVNVPPGLLEVAFQDFHAAVRFQMGGLRSLRAMFYQGTGAFGLDARLPEGVDPGSFDDSIFEDAFRWRNRAAQLRYEWVPSRRMFMNASAWTTAYRMGSPVSVADASALPSNHGDFNEIVEAGVRVSGDLATSSRNFISGAIEGSLTDGDFAVSLDPFGAEPAGPAQLRPVRWRIAAFVEDRATIGRGTTVSLGARMTYLPGQQAVYAEPRIGIQIERGAMRGGSWTAWGALGIYRQFLHAFDIATYNVASLLPRVRYWMPIGRIQRPPEAYHSAAGFVYRPGAALQFELEGYYKHQPHILVLDYGRWQSQHIADDVLRRAQGYAYGIAASASRRTDRLQLSAQYEYGVARRRIPNRFAGRYVPVPWDAPHRVHLALDMLPVRRWTVTLRWEGVFGRSWGFRQAYYDFLEPLPERAPLAVFDPSNPAAHVLPALSRWDVGLAYATRIARASVQARVSFINVFGRPNVVDWSLHYDEQARVYVRRARSGGPFIPSLSLRLSL